MLAIQSIERALSSSSMPPPCLGDTHYRLKDIFSLFLGTWLAWFLSFRSRAALSSFILRHSDRVWSSVVDVLLMRAYVEFLVMSQS